MAFLREWWGALLAIAVLCAGIFVLVRALALESQRQVESAARNGVTPIADAPGVFRDNATGCHYLRVGIGGLTPRLDGDWRHVGCIRRAAAP